MPISTNQNERLYEPLRKSLLKTNLSQSNISSQSRLSGSYLGELSSSRVSKRLRSLSPEEVQQISRNIYIPLKKKLVPTKNYQKIRNKRFSAINVEQKYYPAIQKINFNLMSNPNSQKVEEVVYETEEQLKREQAQQQLNRNRFVRQSIQQQNIYIHSSPIRQKKSSMRINSTTPRILQTVSNNTGNIYTNYTTGNITNTLTNNVMQSSNVSGYFNNGSNRHQPFRETVTSERVVSPVVSRTSFQRSNQKTGRNIYTAPTNIRYDFGQKSTLTQTTTTNNFSSVLSEEYKTKKQQKFKYNLMSILDEPVNTKCKKTGCLNNQIFASIPKGYEWTNQ